MTIDVDLQMPDLAAVTITPHIVRRILFGAATETRFAVRVLVISGGFGWIWDDTGKRIDDPFVLVAIDRAVHAARHPQTITAITGPAD